jgi:Domain of unknown function (DUF4382)
VRIKRSAAYVFLGCISVSLFLLATCSDGGSGPSSSRSSSTTPGTVVTSISDPSTCASPNGAYSHIFVTVTDIQIHQSATAQPSDSGWVDLTPQLTPTQIDLLSTATTSCFLATFAANTQIPSGEYQQIRVILLDNGSVSRLSNNQCGSTSVNCVVLASNGSTQTLEISSEATTGIKIPSGQIAGGKFVVRAGQQSNLDIDFNACSSIVVQGNGQLRLKPVTHAGEVGANTTSISGRLVDSLTGAVISGGKVIVALEAVDRNSVGRVVMEKVPDGAGKFVLCPVPAGNFILVATAIDGNNVAYAPTVVVGVQAGADLGDMPLIAQLAPATASGTIQGQVTSTSAANAGVSVDVTLAALQSISVSGNAVTQFGGSVQVTIPQLGGQSANQSLATAQSPLCPTNTQCVQYSVQLPATLPNIGTVSSTGISFAQASGGATYTMDAQAFSPSSGNTATCSPSEQKTSNSLALPSGAVIMAPDLVFTGCN